MPWELTRSGFSDRNELKNRCAGFRATDLMRFCRRAAVSMVLVSIAVHLMAASIASAEFTPGIVNARTLTYAGNVRHYDVHAPTGYDGTVDLPVVIDVHGLGSNKTEHRDLVTRFETIADVEGFLVVYPLGLYGAPGVEDQNPLGAGVGDLLGPSFNGGDLCCGSALLNDDDDEGFFQQLVVAVAKEGSVDTSRVYMTGLSNGGAMTQTLACNGGHFISAFAPVAFPGAFSPQSSCVPVRPIPIIAFAGITDVVIPYAGGFILSDPTLPIVASAQDTFNFWRDTNACVGTTPDTTESIGASSMCERYTNCSSGADVELCSVDGLTGSPFFGHAPYFNNDALDLEQRAWDFMSAHALPPTDISGSWQVNYTCTGAVERTGFATVTQAAGSNTFSYPPGAPCGSGQLGPQVVPIVSCSGTPTPFVGNVTGNSLTLPASGFVETESVYETPIVYEPFCGLTPIASAGGQARNEGIVTEFNGSTATRIEGDTFIGIFSFYDEFDVACLTFDLTPSPAPCTFYMLRNDVSTGSDVTVEPFDGGTITFDNVTTTGIVSVTQTTEASVVLPPNFQTLGAGIFFVIETTATFTGLVEVCLPYDDIDNDGIVDGTTVSEVDLVMLRDGVPALAQIVNTVDNQVCGDVPGFSEFVLGSTTAQVPALEKTGIIMLVAMIALVGVANGRRTKRA